MTNGVTRRRLLRPGGRHGGGPQRDGVRRRSRISGRARRKACDLAALHRHTRHARDAFGRIFLAPPRKCRTWAALRVSKTALDRERMASRGPCFVFDGGDEFQGSGPAAWSQGEVILKPLNALGADVFTPGNGSRSTVRRSSKRPWRGSPVPSLATIYMKRRAASASSRLRSCWSGRASGSPSSA